MRKSARSASHSFNGPRSLMRRLSLSLGTSVAAVLGSVTCRPAAAPAPPPAAPPAVAANAVLTMEANADGVWKYTDTDGDGKADKRELFTTRYGRSGNVEHQQAFLYWAMDNWLYSTYNAFRIRPGPNGTMLREPTGPN